MSICASSEWGTKFKEVAQDHGLEPTIHIEPFGYPGYAVIRHGHRDCLYSLDEWGFKAFLQDLPIYSTATFRPKFIALAAKAGIEEAIAAWGHTAIWFHHGEYSLNKNGYDAFVRRLKREFPALNE
ncbi:hypothetical protein IKM56_04265 [Candidatus Saccharibacteria bacterium]|nr:hypothetical protein [Candidatus Saccharibacteria bacterium]